MKNLFIILICCLLALFSFLAGLGIGESKGNSRVNIHVDKEHETVCYTYRESITCMPMFNDDEPN